MWRSPQVNPALCEVLRKRPTAFIRNQLILHRGRTGGTPHTIKTSELNQTRNHFSSRLYPLHLFLKSMLSPCLYFPHQSSSFPFSHGVFLFCCYPSDFQRPLNFWLQYFSWNDERVLHPKYFQDQTQNEYFIYVQGITHREKASMSTPGKAASRAMATHDLCLCLTKKAEQGIIASFLSFSRILLGSLSASWPYKTLIFSHIFTLWANLKNEHVPSVKI